MYNISMESSLQVVDGRISFVSPMGHSKKDPAIVYTRFGIIQPIYDFAGEQVDSRKFDCVAFGSLAEKIDRMPITSAKHLDEDGNFKTAWIGTRVVAVGKMMSSSYQDQKTGEILKSETFKVINLALPIQDMSEDDLTHIIDQLRAFREKRII